MENICLNFGGSISLMEETNKNYLEVAVNIPCL